MPRSLPAWSAGIRSQDQSARRPARTELPATCNRRPRRQGKFPPDGAQCADGVLCCFCVVQRPHAPPRVRGPCVFHGFASIRIHAIHCISLRKQMDLYDGFAQLHTTGGGYPRGDVGNTYPSHLGNTNNHDICSNDLGRAKCCFSPLQPEKLAPFAATRHRT